MRTKNGSRIGERTEQQSCILAAAVWIKFLEQHHGGEEQHGGETESPTTMPMFGTMHRAYAFAKKLGWHGDLSTFPAEVETGLQGPSRILAELHAMTLEIPEFDPNGLSKTQESCVLAAAIWLRFSESELDRWRKGERKAKPCRREAYDIAVSLGYRGGFVTFCEHIRQGLRGHLRTLAQQKSDGIVELMISSCQTPSSDLLDALSNCHRYEGWQEQQESDSLPRLLPFPGNEL